MQFTPDTQITLQQFIGIENSQGLFKTYTDIIKGLDSPLLANAEVLDAPIIKPTSVIGDNVEFSNMAFGQVHNFNDKMTDFEADIETLDKLVMKLYDDYNISFKYTLMDRTSAADWASRFGQFVNGLYMSRSDINNLIAIEAIKDYCLVNGQYIILPDIDYKQVDTKTYNDATAVITEECNRIVTTRTQYNLGLNPDMLRMYLSYNVYQNMVRGVNYISAANLSLEAYKSGKFTEFLGYPTQRTMYCGQDVLKTVDQHSSNNNVRDFKNRNLLGFIYSVDTLAFYERMLLIDTELRDPSSVTNRYWVYAFRANAAIRPARGQLCSLILREAPTLAEVTESYNRLTKQIGFYPNIKQPTQEWLDFMNRKNNKTITPVAVDSVSALAYPTTIAVNETTRVYTNVLPQNADQSVTFASSNETIATVDATGLVTGIGAGTATITVTSVSDSSKTATVEITVA